MMTLSIILLALAIIVQIYDAWSTITIIRGGGIEKNKLVAWVIGRAGLVPAVVCLKLGISGVMVWLVCGYGEHWPIPVALAAVIVFYVKMFWNNNFKHDGI